MVKGKIANYLDGPTVATDLAYSYSTAVEAGLGLFELNGIFRVLIIYTVLPSVRTRLMRLVLSLKQDLAYSYSPAVETGLG